MALQRQVCLEHSNNRDPAKNKQIQDNLRRWVLEYDLAVGPTFILCSPEHARLLKAFPVDCATLRKFILNAVIRKDLYENHLR
eukprot:2897951-Pleurochrysis_carterae.AAC.1